MVSPGVPFFFFSKESRIQGGNEGTSSDLLLGLKEKTPFFFRRTDIFIIYQNCTEGLAQLFARSLRREDTIRVTVLDWGLNLFGVDNRSF